MRKGCRMLVQFVLPLVALGILATPARADYKCGASVNRQSVAQGGEVVLTVATRGDVGWSPEFEMPEIGGVRMYAGGTNQSMSMVNGRTETSVSRTYFLKVETDKDFTIPPVTIRSGGQSCSTEPITVRVTPPRPGQSPPPANTGNRGIRPDPGAGGEPGDDVFVTLEPDLTEAWVGQQIVLTFRYWRRVQPWNNPSYTPPRTEGFWREDLGEHNSRKVLRGRAYNVTEIRYAIFPTRTGDLTIEPARLSFPAGVFDRFFQTRRSRTGPQVLQTDPVTIRVKPLPRPEPAGYSGIVATELDLVSTVDRDSVPRGEAIGLKVRLTADGFLKGFSDLPVPQPPTARLHDAGESYRTAIDRRRLIGTIGVEKVIVPDVDGVLTVPPVELVWFDAVAGTYRTARTEAWSVRVSPSDRPLPGDDESGFLRNEIARLGEDLAFIHQVPRNLSRRMAPWTGGFAWWVALVVPVVALVVYRLYLVRVAAERRDPASRRRRGALGRARTRLTARPAVGPERVAKAICGYIADCHDRPLASIGPDEVLAHCRAVHRGSVGRRLVEILETCDAARFGGDRTGGGQGLVDEVVGLLTELDQARLEGGGRVPHLAILVLLILAAGTAAPAGAEDDRPGTDPARLVAEANQAYTEGDIAEAKRLYLAARDLGINDPVLHFNLGNAHAREGELGRAVASYLRARRLAPRDRDISGNLEWVRRHIQDLEFNENRLPLFIAQLAAVVGALTLDQWGVVLVILVWIGAGLAAWGWHRERFGSRLRQALLGTAALLLLVGAITAGRYYDERVRRTAVVVAPEVPVRSGPAENFSTLFEVHDGLTLTIVGERDDWVRVGMGGDWEGWVPAVSVTEVRRTSGLQGR
jgi:hypothetical protein